MHERYRSEQLFTTTLPWTVGFMLLLGLGGGALMSRNMLARLDSINRTSGEIMAGDLSRRVPIGSAHDEFDALAENLNAMLERIERLMKGVREVTDSVAHDLRTHSTGFATGWKQLYVNSIRPVTRRRRSRPPSPKPIRSSPHSTRCCSSQKPMRA